LFEDVGLIKSARNSSTGHYGGIMHRDWPTHVIRKEMKKGLVEGTKFELGSYGMLVDS